MRSFRERYAALNNASKRLVEHHPVGSPIEQLELGTLLRNSSGEIFVAESRHQDARLRALSRRNEVRSSLYLRSQRHPSIRTEDILFLDTETTGLAGGTGTQAFLVGVGYFDDDNLVLRQFFMRSPADEPALLEQLQIVLDRAHLLVTFNGKSFDWPLLDTRFLLHGYRLEFGFDHLDLLHPARRIWKHRLESCSLTSLEQGVFGLWRNGDVPGYLIPQLYFNYLRDGDARRLEPVFAHNREDIVTLARLLEVLLAAEMAPDTILQHPADRVGMGLALAADGQLEIGYRTLSEALSAGDLPPQVRRRGEIELWRLMKRAGRMHEGVDLLESMCRDSSRARVPDLLPFIELAKYHEHVTRDYDQAERVVERAVRLVELHVNVPGRDELIHRLQRIRRKQVTPQL